MTMRDDIIAAVEAARAGDWEAAHTTAQKHQGNRQADWLHAILHVVEGDEANARYWYGRCERDPNACATVDADYDALLADLGAPL
ncbi:MAG: hypothetical protein AAFY53_13645 [Pseudomonadota bacterium]